MNELWKTKQILVEFLGGDWDGRTIDSLSGDPLEASLAIMFCEVLHGGTEGKGWKGVSMSQMERARRGELKAEQIDQVTKTHQYTVVERLEDDNTVYFRMKYSVGQPNPESEP